MKRFVVVLSFICFGYANAQNTNITVDANLNLTCAFEKVILKNPDHNFETFTKDQIKRDDINKLVIESKSPNLLNIKNLSNFFDKIELEVKISNKDVVLIQAFDDEKNYSESAVLTIKTGELVHEITKNIKLEEKEKILILRDKIKDLPDQQKKILMLYYFEELRLSEIAHIFGLTEGRISQILSQTLLTLKAQFKT